MLDFEVTIVMCVNYLIVVWFSIVIYQVMCMCFCHYVGSKLCVSDHQNSYWIDKVKTVLSKCEKWKHYWSNVRCSLAI
jgi:hypothetical protein